jgi:hypothetical protein
MKGGTGMSTLAERLAKIHAKYGIYSESQINAGVEENILDYFEGIAELNYLKEYYKRYLSHYEKEMNGVWRNNKFIDDNLSRSTDLPFIGTEVLEKGKANYFFIFKGSLQKPEKLSMTVLSCLWLFKDITPHIKILNQFWPKTQNYHPLVSNLGITPQVARKSYVTDFARVANVNGRRDTRKSKEVLLAEIELVKPEIVVLVGAEPRDAFFKEIIDTPERYIHVPFSLKGVPKQTQDEGPALYRALRNRLEEV